MDKIQLQFLRSLYGDSQGPSVAEIEEAQRRRSESESEGSHQARLVAYLRKLGLPHFAPYNEGHMLACVDESQRMKVARRAKAMGMSAGMLDIAIQVARKPYHGLYIELKSKPYGRVSPAQEWWLKTLVEQDYKAVVSWSFEESLEIVTDYLALPQWESQQVRREENICDRDQQCHDE